MSVVCIAWEPCWFEPKWLQYSRAGAAWPRCLCLDRDLLGGNGIPLGAVQRACALYSWRVLLVRACLYVFLCRSAVRVYKDLSSSVGCSQVLIAEAVVPWRYAAILVYYLVSNVLQLRRCEPLS